MLLGACGSFRQLDPLSAHCTRGRPASKPTAQGTQATALTSEVTALRAQATAATAPGRLTGAVSTIAPPFSLLFPRTLGVPLVYRLLPARAKQGPLLPLLLRGTSREVSAPADTPLMPPEPGVEAPSSYEPPPSYEASPMNTATKASSQAPVDDSAPSDLRPPTASFPAPILSSSSEMSPGPTPLPQPPHPFRLRRDSRGKEALEHTDPHAHLRWSPRLCMEFLDARPWPATTAFYKTLVAGTASFADVRPLPSLSPRLPPGGVPPLIQALSVPGAERDPADAVPDRPSQQEPIHLAGGQAEGQKRGGKRGTPEQGSSSRDGTIPQGERGPSEEGAEDKEAGEKSPPLLAGEAERSGGERGTGKHSARALHAAFEAQGQDAEDKNERGAQGAVSLGAVGSGDHSNHQGGARVSAFGGHEEGPRSQKWDVGETRRGPRWARKTVKVELAYLGEAFGGYQFQNDQHTVQGVLQVALRPFCESHRGEAGDAGGVPWKTRRQRREQRRLMALQGLAQLSPGAADAERRAEKDSGSAQGPERGCGPAGVDRDSLPAVAKEAQQGAVVPGALAQEELVQGPGQRTAGGRDQDRGKERAEERAEERGDKVSEKDAAVFVAGRTDKGVSAVGQVCSFHTWREPLDLDQIRDAINASSPGTLRAVSVTGVPRDFHPAFSASWRRYVYLLPLLPGEGGAPEVRVQDALETEYESPGEGHTAHGYSDTAPRYSDSATDPSVSGAVLHVSAAGPSDGNGGCSDSRATYSDSGATYSDRGATYNDSGATYSDSGGTFSDSGARKNLKAAGVDGGRIHSMLQELVRRGPLCYTAYARNTPSDRSGGAATVCRLLRATASLVELPVGVPGALQGGMPGAVPEPMPEGAPRDAPGGVEGMPAGCALAAYPNPCRALLVELIADRFLRRMVRVLVSTAVREAAAGAPLDILCQLAETGERRATAPPAPAQGLCLCQVGYHHELPPPLGERYGQYNTVL